MSKGVAIVTGGTRGIGLEITRGLMEEGYQVAAVYHGNDEAAKACEQQTNARTFKFDVADFDACQSGCAEIESALGPVTLLVNNAG